MVNRIMVGCLLGLALLGILTSPGRAAAAEAMADAECLDCHAQSDLTTTNAAGREISLFVDAAKLAASVHRTNTCASCHVEVTRGHPDDGVKVQSVQCATCHRDSSESYGRSVHAEALRNGEPGAASCTDCHGSHAVLPPMSPDSPLHFSRLAQTCGGCHPDAAQEVAESVHGQATAHGDREAATCTDCHLEHRIEALKGASARRVSEQVCGKCHASERINTKFRLPADRVQTFFESYHGLAVQYGSARAANCASCHGYHRVLPSNDPRSTVHPGHLVETCGKCHPGATEKFALGRIHMNGIGDDWGSLINRWVRWTYIGLIVGVVGFLLTHNGLAWMRKVLWTRRAPGRWVLRMDRSQRRQHLILLLSFIALALTGFALKYPDSWLAWMLGANENFRRWAHRVAGVALLGLGAYHVVYACTTAAGRQLVRDLWPRRQDGRDMASNLRHFVRGTPRPRFGRFGYVEKFEYWAVAWGTVIMGVTGLAIWFKLGVTHWLPRWVVEVATTIHYYEAILACLAIVVWHFYHVIFDPDVYPMNWAWWNGKVPETWHEEEHPLDHSAPRITDEPANAPTATPPPPGKPTGPDQSR